MNLNSLSNTELFRCYVEKGSKEAINIFFQNQMDLFYRIAFKYTKNAADAEDVLQAAFISIMETAHQYKGIHTDEEKLLLSWCLSVVVHCSLMKIRTDSNRRNRETNYLASNAKPFYEENTMEKTNENEVVHQKVKDAIIQLPEKYRIPIHLKYVEGFELDAIANILKLNANTLRSLIKRGLEKVSAQLKEDNVTLSSVGLISLIEGLPIEKAPFAYQSIATKILDTANSSGRLFVNTSPKAALLFAKIIISLAVIFASVTGGIYSWKKLKTESPVAVFEGSKPILPQNVIKNQNDTNQTWAFVNENDRAIPLLIGKWEWSSENKSMISDADKPLMISLPIIDQAKPFIIECDLAANMIKGIPQNGVHFNAYWVRNNHILAHEYYLGSIRYDFHNASVKKMQLYFYNNFICHFINGKCYQINRITENIKDANIAITSVNFIFQKISSRTLEEPPIELLEVMENKLNQKVVLHENWLIDENSLMLRPKKILPK